MLFQNEPHVSWLREFLFPAVFVILGAGLTYFAGQLSEDRKAKRAKNSFLRVVGMELDALDKQLNGSLLEVAESAERVRSGFDAGPQFAGVLRTSVFSSQLVNLRDVDDLLLVEVVHFYSDLGTVQQCFERASELGAEFTRAHVPSGQKDSLRPQLLSALTVLQEQIKVFDNRLKKLRAKLPS